MFVQVMFSQRTRSGLVQTVPLFPLFTTDMTKGRRLRKEVRKRETRISREVQLIALIINAFIISFNYCLNNEDLCSRLANRH